MSSWRNGVRRELARYRHETGHLEFTLEEAYDHILPELRQEFPNNNNPKAKLRQVLQQLRDRGEIEFLGDGVYRIIALDLDALHSE